MNKNFIKYLIINVLITILLPIIASIIILYLYFDLNFNDISIIIELIPWIFYKLMLDFDFIFKNPIIFFVLPYIIYYTLFIFLHYFLYKYYKKCIWYIFTFIISILNIYFWFQVYILMTS